MQLVSFNTYPVDSVYPMDGATQLLNNWGQDEAMWYGKDIGVRAGGARGAAAPQILGNSDFLSSERKFGQSQFFKTFPCFLNHYFEEINIFYFNLKLA